MTPDVSYMLIRRAFEVQLNTMVPAIPIAWENVDFQAPSGPYQRFNLVPGRPENPTSNKANFTREVGFAQITLMYPTGAGPKAAETQASAIRARFAAGTELSNGGVNVVIDGTPEIRAGSPDGDRWSIPVRIPYYANIS